MNAAHPLNVHALPLRQGTARRANHLREPRNLFSREAEALRIQLTDLLRDEVDRAFAEQEALTA